MRHVKRILSRNGFRLFIFEVLYRMSMLLILYPLIRLLFHWSLGQMGYSNLTNRNLLPFLGNPCTIFSFFLVLFLAVVFFLVEFCTLLIGFTYSNHSMKIRISEMFLCGCKKAWSVFRKGKLAALFWTLNLLPFLYFPFFLLLAGTHQLSRYLLERMLASRIGILCFVFVMLAILFLSVLGIFLLPHFAIEEKPEKKTAVHLARKHYFRILFYLILCNLSLCLIALCFFFLLIFGGICYSSFFVRPGIRLSFLLGFKGQATTITLFFVLIHGGLYNLGLLYVLFTHYRERDLGRKVLYNQFQNEKEWLKKKTVRRVSVFLMILLLVESVIFVREAWLGLYTIRTNFVDTQVTAHRGGDHALPENTLAALEESIDSMVSYAEIDVQETADGVVILMHDENLRRTTGINEYVYNITYSELLNWNKELYRGDDFNMEYVPTLATVLQMCNGKIKLNIDIKSNKNYNDSLVPKVVSLIETYSSPEQCMVSSTNYHYLEQAKELNPDIMTGYIMKVAYGDLRDMDAIDFVSVKYSCVTDQLVESAHRNGIQIHVWTVNSRNAINRMKGLDVDNIITDRPALAREILARQDDRIGFLELLELFVRD